MRDVSDNKVFFFQTDATLSYICRDFRTDINIITAGTCVSIYFNYILHYFIYNKPTIKKSNQLLSQETLK